MSEEPLQVCRTLPFRDVAPALREQLVALASSVCPGLDAARYLDERRERYGTLLVAEQGSELRAFELLDEHEERGGRYVYLGPLFSRHGAYLPMFLAWLDPQLDDVTRSLTLLAEAQCPEVVMAWKRLFLRSSWPRIRARRVPEAVRAAVETFARRLDHIGAIDTARLATRSSTTLYRPRRGYHPALEWMRRRGVHPERGDAQLLVVGVRAGRRARDRFRREVMGGLFAMGRPGWRARMEQLFDGGGR